MANPDQKTILIDKNIKRYQVNSSSSDSEIKTLLREIARLWEIEEKITFGFRL